MGLRSDQIILHLFQPHQADQMFDPDLRVHFSKHRGAETSLAYALASCERPLASLQDVDTQPGSLLIMHIAPYRAPTRYSAVIRIALYSLSFRRSGIVSDIS